MKSTMNTAWQIIVAVMLFTLRTSITADLLPDSLVSQTDALYVFKNALADPKALESWNDRRPCSGKWQGITCSSDQSSVVKMSLEGSKFFGPLPKEVEGLDFLESLVVMNTAFTGQLPAAIENLKKLKTLIISKNPFLSGEFPESIFNLTKIQKLDLSWNNLTGILPGVPPFSTPPPSQLIPGLSHMNWSDIFPPVGAKPSFPWPWINMNNTAKINGTDWTKLVNGPWPMPFDGHWIPFPLPSAPGSPSNWTWILIANPFNLPFPFNTMPMPATPLLTNLTTPGLLMNPTWLFPNLSFPSGFNAPFSFPFHWPPLNGYGPLPFNLTWPPLNDTTLSFPFKWMWPGSNTSVLVFWPAPNSTLPPMFIWPFLGSTSPVFNCTWPQGNNTVLPPVFNWFWPPLNPSNPLPINWTSPLVNQTFSPVFNLTWPPAPPVFNWTWPLNVSAPPVFNWTRPLNVSDPPLMNLTWPLLNTSAPPTFNWTLPIPPSAPLINWTWPWKNSPPPAPSLRNWTLPLPIPTFPAAPLWTWPLPTPTPPAGTLPPLVNWTWPSSTPELSGVHSFRDLPNLTYLDLSHNAFLGALPEGLEKLTRLYYLNLSNNFLFGDTPFTLFESPHVIDLSNNFLSGNLVSAEQFAKSITLNISENCLTGVDPSREFARDQKISLQDNCLNSATKCKCIF